MDRPDWAPKEVDIGQPSIARVYDYLLGGAHNFEADRRMGEDLLAAERRGRVWARANRDFLRRVVRFLVAEGVRQFLDLGSGIPTVGNVHEIAQSLSPGARVVYVDIDRVAVAHSREMLDDDPNAGVVLGDLREPEKVLADPVALRLIDFSRPVAVLAVAVLHFVPESDAPGAVLLRYREAVPPGSYLAISHMTRPSAMRPEVTGAVRSYNARVAQLTFRDRDQIEGLFDGWDLVDPGVAGVAFWRPDSPVELAERMEEAEGIPGFVGVARRG